MIAVSGLLVLVAFVTLVVGIFQPGLGLIYVSIGASVLAAISLATGVVKTRPKAVAVGPEPIGGWGGTATPVLDRPAEEPPGPEEAPVTSVLSLEEPRLAEEPFIAEEEEEPAPATAARARKAPAKKAPAKKAAAKRTGSPARATGGTVVVVPGRDKYHKDSCRYAKGEATQSLTKAAAKKEGYVACGVCKP